MLSTQSSKTARLFFALKPPFKIRVALEKVARKVAVDQGGRSVKPGNIHLTLVFLGDVAMDKINVLHEVAADIAALPFSLSIQGTAYWKKNQIVMAKVEQFPAELFAMADTLKTALNAAGFDCESRQYKPHITLIRKASGHEPVQLEKPIKWDVKGWTLMQSRLTEHGSHYTELGCWSFRTPLKMNH